MILIAGGTGTLGRELITLLTAAGTPVRVLTRDPARAAGLPVEVAVGDVRDARTLGPAVAGCSAVVSAVHGFLGGRGSGPEAVDDEGNGHLVRAAADAGADRFVLVSVLGARPDHPMALHRAKYAAEQHLKAGGVPWTIIRPSAYIETWAAILGAKADGGPALVFGRGDNPVNFVFAGDVAALVARVVSDPTFVDREIDVPGPDNLTMVQLAGLLGATRIRHVPRLALRAMAVVAAPFQPALARQARTALVMDSTDMTADATRVQQLFGDLSWQHAASYRGSPKHD